MRIVQFTTDAGRAVGIVEGETLRVVDGFSTVFDMAMSAIERKIPLADLAAQTAGSTSVSYDEVVATKRLLPPVNHPEPARFWATGTGLTHTGSASARDAMHAHEHGIQAEMTDSMKIFHMGLAGGKPAAGEIGVQPEWFYKGNGTCVIAPEQTISQPAFARAGGEEAEITGLYIIGPDGAPYRLGFALSNEFSDQVTEAENYLYLAHSKLRQCSIGPELVVGVLPEDVRGVIRIVRDGAVLWQDDFISGEANMSHSIANLEHYHFRYEMFRRPGDVHAHFFGASSLSCSAGVATRPGDRFEIDVPAFGRPLRNTLALAVQPKVIVSAL